MPRFQDHFDQPSSSNRVADALFMYVEQEALLKVNNPIASRSDSYDIDLKLNYYQGIRAEYGKSKNGLEKNALKYLRHEIRRLKAQKNPTLFNRLFYSDFFELLKSTLRHKDNPINQYHTSIKNLEVELVQKHNLQTLSSELKKSGFTIEMEGALKRMINQNLPQFHLRYADVANPNAHYVVHFKKIPKTNLYYFEKFDAISRPSLDALLNNDANCVRHSFYIQDPLKINANEAAKIVNGKSVCKVIDGEDQWIMGDCFPARRNELRYYRFDLEKAMLKLPIQERENYRKYQEIIQSVRSGSKREVTLMFDSMPTKCYIEAAPHNNNLYVLDKSNRLLDVDRLSNTNKAAKLVINMVESQEQTLGRSKSQKFG